MNKKILVTGGAGFIGSHTCVELLNAGYEVSVLDNLRNAKTESLKRVREITGREAKFHKVDLCDRAGIRALFAQDRYEAVIHFAGLKAVGESVQIPLDYYHNNVTGTVILLEEMAAAKVKKLVFSSSATVYGEPETVPIRENFARSATNPYGRTKLMIEYILEDLAVSDPEWKIIPLRYFNPIGAHESGKIGEDPSGIPNNLLPYVAQVAVGRLKQLKVFGSDYDTHDGTGVRDYIHVVDLALGHLKALERLDKVKGFCPYNLGTGKGYSVLDVVRAFEKASGKSIAYELAPRRSGDVPVSYADPSLAERELGWVATRGIEDMCRDTWKWQSNNPNGYPEDEQP